MILTLEQKSAIAKYAARLGNFNFWDTYNEDGGSLEDCVEFIGKQIKIAEAATDCLGDLGLRDSLTLEEGPSLGQITSLLSKHNISYLRLEFGRTPEQANGVRTLYIITDMSGDADRIRALRTEFDEDYGIHVAFVRP